MRTLQLGSTGEDVKQLQINLNKFFNGKRLIEDGTFGRETKRVVIMFQTHVLLLPDGIFGPQTRYALNNKLAALAPIVEPTVPQNFKHTVERFNSLKDKLVGLPVVYGPGRGLFDANNPNGKQWVVTWGPGSYGLKGWKGGKKGPAFHCSSLVNFALSYMINRNENYTHAGNIPTTIALASQDNNLHKVAPTENEKFRGYAGRLFRIASDGDTAHRAGSKFAWDEAHKFWDATEIGDRLSELPFMTVFLQTDFNPTSNKFNWEHHTGFFIHYDKNDTDLYRFASDGYCGKDGAYSCTPIVWQKYGYAKNTYYELFSFDLSIPPEFPTEYPIEFEK